MVARAPRIEVNDNVHAMNATRPLTAAQRTSLESALRTRQRELRADVAAKLKTQDDP